MKIEDIRKHNLPQAIGEDWWNLSEQEAKERYATAYKVEVPTCQSHNGQWVANYTHYPCRCKRTIVQGVVYQTLEHANT